MFVPWMRKVKTPNHVSQKDVTREGEPSLLKLSSTLWAKTFHTLLFKPFFCLPVLDWICSLIMKSDTEEQRREEGLRLECCPSGQHQQLRQPIYQRARSGIIFKTVCFKWGFTHQTHTHIYTCIHIMKRKIMEKPFIPKRYSWVSLFYSFGHFSLEDICINVLGCCACLLRQRKTNSFPSLIVFTVALLIPRTPPEVVTVPLFV